MNKNLEIYFVTSVVDINVGSYRIWVNDLAQYFNDIGVKSSINKLPLSLNNKGVIILGKSNTHDYGHYKKQYPNNLIGIINPTGNVKYKADFIIVGSVEEKDSLSKNDQVFIFPLIERKYKGISHKIHHQKDRIVIGVHGSYTHLCKFNPHLKQAIEEFSQHVDIHLKVITNGGAPKWTYGKPKINNIEMIAWNLETFSEELMKCDVGVVPNISDDRPLFKKTSKGRGLYNTDYFFRFKNKSNSGRMFVFIQHGIPVIADLTPSNLHILGNPDNGYAVFSKDGWLKALKELSYAEKRNEISKSAFDTLQDLYDPIVWAKKLINNIQEINITC